jgi:hypothetical protein
MNVGKSSSSTLKLEMGKINTSCVNLINGLHIVNRTGVFFQGCQGCISENCAARKKTWLCSNNC